MSVFVIPVFNHGGKLLRANGNLHYLGGKVDKFPPMDIDFVNKKDLEELFKGLGYLTYKEIYWHDPTAIEFEDGLHVLYGDKEINDMCDFCLRNNLKEFHLYFEHGVDIPVVTDDEPVVEEVDSEDEDVLVVTGSEKSSSSSYDSYESAEDEAYKPPPSGYETENSDESVHIERKKKKNSKSPKTMAKRRASRRYTGKRRRKHVLNMEMESGPSSADSGLGQGPGSGGSVGPDLENMDGPDIVGNVGQKGVATEGGEEGVDGDDIVYEYESEGFVTPLSSDDERGPVGPEFTEGKTFGEVQFRLGMQFATMEQFKRALKDVFVQDGRDCMYLKNEPGRVRAACAEEDCPWLIFVSKNSVTKSFEVKTFHSEHTCGRDYGSNLADRKWVAEKLGLRLKTQPKLTPKEAMQHMKEDYSVQLNRKMITRAIKEARETVLGSEGAQFGKLRDYLNEIHKSNPGSTAHMNTLPQPQGPNLFDRLYISFDACKRGFINGCRPLIGLDGCFLKGYYGGQLLSAVTQDANNQIFVIAFGVTRVENTDNWKWFLTCLQEDFGASMLFGWHLMSDQQKGLVKAVQQVMPNAFHRNCVLHMWKNCEKRFRDKQVKGCVWEAARSTTPVQFKAAMDKLKTVSNGAWEYMSKFDPTVWCRAFFSHYPKNAAVTNNMCESWNAIIMEAREKPILTLCEELRVHIMNKMARQKRVLGGYKGRLAPVQQMKLDKWIKPQSHKWNAQWCGDNDRVVFEVTRNTHKLGVNLKNQTCTCNLWQLTGVPCVHAVAAISRVRVKSAEDFVSPFLTMEALRKTYDICINPVPSEEFWEPTDQLKADPPKIVRPIGRPVKRRKDSATPPAPHDGNKVRRTFQVTCSKCGESGHYFKTCKGAPKNPNWQPKSRKKNKGGPSSHTDTTPMPQKPKPTLQEIRDKLKKQKKKMPKRPHAPQEEIPITQSAPPVQSQGEPATPGQPTPAPPGQPTPAAPIQPTPALQAQPKPAPPVQASARPQVQPSGRFRPKLKTFRPPGPVNPQIGHQLPATPDNLHAISNETVAASSGGTSSDLFKFIPTPNFNPPKQP